LPYPPSRLPTSVTFHCSCAACAGSKSIRSRKKEPGCSPRPYVGTGVFPFHFTHCIHPTPPHLPLPGGATDPLYSFIHAGQIVELEPSRAIPSTCPRPQMSSKPPQRRALSHSHACSCCPVPGHHLIRIRLQSNASAFVRVDLFQATGVAPVASSGALTNARSGAATGQVALRAGQYILVPAMDGIPGANRTFSLMVYSSSAGTSIAPL
jgi:hypothetical protein